MKKILVLFLILFAGQLNAKEITVYTYSSFTADWGPGPAIKKTFEAQCDCQLNFVSVDDAAALLSRLQIEGKNSKADVVLGLDTNLMAEAQATGLFAKHDIKPQGLSVPGGWSNAYFLPFDYGYFAFVYNKNNLASPPDSMQSLIDGPTNQKIIIEDPRTSTPGLGLLLWIQYLYKDRADEIWEKLNKRILTVTKSWSEAYGLFLEEEAPLVLSYTTSPAYHLIAEGNSDYAAARFSEGQYLQVEIAGVLRSSSQPTLAREFLRFMMSNDFQQHIPTGNWMYPVRTPADGLPTDFKTLIKPTKALYFSPDEVASHRKKWIRQWLNAISR